VEVRLDSVEGKIDRVEVRLDSVEGKIDRVGKRVGGLGRRLGQFTELLVLPGVLQAFRKQGYNAVTVKQDERFYLGARTVAEVDILLRNDQGEYIAIEVKTASDSSDIKSIEKHRIQLQVIEPLLKRDDPEFKRLLGGYICMIPAQEVQKAVLNAGLYALMARGIEIELYIPESLQAGK
jgi:hypothetical protein